MQILRHRALLTWLKKGVRNGNWRKLNRLDRALYRAAMWYAKRGGSIVDGKLVEKLLGVIERLKETKGMRIFKRGFEKAVVLLEKRGRERDVCMGAFVTVLAERSGLYIRLGTVR